MATLNKNMIHRAVLYGWFYAKGLLNRNRVKEQLNEPPILIGGCGRSGTTLLLSMLSAHPEIYAIPKETGAFCPTAYSEKPDLNAPFNKTTYFYGKYFDEIPDSCNRWCEKTPKNVQFFGRLLDYFEGNVRLIHLIRDGRDVVTSRHPTLPNQFWVSPERWVCEVKMGLEVEGTPQLISVKYEELVLDYEKTMGRICKFLDMEFGHRIRNWHEFTTVRKNRAWSGEVKPAFSKSIGKWKRPEFKERVSEFMENPEACNLLKELGYMG